MKPANPSALALLLAPNPYQLVKLSEKKELGFGVAGRWIAVLFLSIASVTSFAMVLGMPRYLHPPLHRKSTCTLKVHVYRQVSVQAYTGQNLLQGGGGGGGGTRGPFPDPAPPWALMTGQLPGEPNQ